MFERLGWIGPLVLVYTHKVPDRWCALHHEFGLDDGSQTPAVAINAFVQSSDFDIGDGQQFMLINRILPDLNFGQSSPPRQRSLQWALETLVGSVAGQGTASGDVTRTSVVSGDELYNQLHMRLRGRQMNLKVESDTTGVKKWRLGAPRLRYETGWTTMSTKIVRSIIPIAPVSYDSTYLNQLARALDNVIESSKKSPC